MFKKDLKQQKITVTENKFSLFFYLFKEELYTFA